MCKQETTIDETVPETSLDEGAESQPEKQKNCVEKSSSVEVEQADEQQLLFPTSTDDDANKTESEMDSPDKSELPEQRNLTAPDDEPVQPEQNTLDEMNKTLSGVWDLLQDSIVQNQDQTKTFGIIQTLPATLSEVKELVESQISRNQNQITMFDKMYREMNSYKDNFLLETVHKPIIHNLVQLYDNFMALESQFKDILNKDDAVGSEGLSQELQQFQANLENVCFELEEALYRMDVSPYEEQPEVLDVKLHKTLKVEPTNDPEEDRKVVKVHKKGFCWGDKVFRREEVTIHQYEPPKAKLEDETNEHTLNEEGVETDE